MELGDEILKEQVNNLTRSEFNNDTKIADANSLADAQGLITLYFIRCFGFLS